VHLKLITVPGRVLPEPRVKYKQEKPAEIRFGGWNLINIKFNTGATLRRWTYLLISAGGIRDAFRDPGHLRSAVDNFHGTLLNIGVTVEPPQPGSRVFLSGPDDVKLEHALKELSTRVQLVLVVLPSDAIPLYQRVKHIGDVKVGVHTVCVVGSKFVREQIQYFANVALKFNLKLGGINQVVDKEHLGIINEDKTMVVGLDVTHPSPGSSSNAPSVAGMVASVDRWLGQWPAVLKIQEGRKEMVVDLKEMLQSRLRLWRSKGKHQAFPENILVYRDGVSEGQYDQVTQEELPLLREACTELYPPADTKKRIPRITIAIVGKRHHTRFYPTEESEADRSSNPRNGTVVDRGITEALVWEVYMQSHAAIQGTARPAHYVVVHDEIFKGRPVKPPLRTVADVFEQLTHSMSYSFGRATKAVSICTPAYYADIVCERARCYLSKVFDPSVSSAAPSQSEGGDGRPADVRPEDVQIHPNLRDTMFYI
jgi:eukaryotic translation initiation factor 2C